MWWAAAMRDIDPARSMSIGSGLTRWAGMAGAATGGAIAGSEKEAEGSRSPFARYTSLAHRPADPEQEVAVSFNDITATKASQSRLEQLRRSSRRKRLETQRELVASNAQGQPTGARWLDNSGRREQRELPASCRTP